MRQKEIVRRLKGLRKEFDRDGIEILDCPAPVALILADVCVALGMGLVQQAEVLGPERLLAIEQWREIRVIPAGYPELKESLGPAVRPVPLPVEGGVTC